MTRISHPVIWLGSLLSAVMLVLTNLVVLPCAHAAPAASKDYPVYSLQRDLRRCAAPACGGWWVTPVNASSQGVLTESLLATAAPLTKPAPEYVANLNFGCTGWTPEQISRFNSLAADRAVLMAGRLLDPSPASTNAALYQYGALQVQAAFVAASSAAANGLYYSVESSGIVCAVAPCPSYQSHLINTDLSQALHALNFDQRFSPEHIQQAHTAIATTSLLVSGGQEAISGPAGKGVRLNIQYIFWPYPAVQPD